MKPKGDRIESHGQSKTHRPFTDSEQVEPAAEAGVPPVPLPQVSKIYVCHA
jgi:hypothetical protein